MARERMNVRDNEVFGYAGDLINAKTLSSVINCSSALRSSQFMDTNQAEHMHVRRPHAVRRETAPVSRCRRTPHALRPSPIESPEGPNIGLISAACVYAKISPIHRDSLPEGRERTDRHEQRRHPLLPRRRGGQDRRAGNMPTTKATSCSPTVSRRAKALTSVTAEEVT